MQSERLCLIGFIRQIDMQKRLTRFSKQDFEKIKQLYPDVNYTVDKIAQIIGCSKKSLHKAAIKLEIEHQRPVRSEVMKQTNKNNPDTGNNGSKKDFQPYVKVEDLGFGCTRRINVVFHENRASQSR
jgi:DNA-binding XRE family transcriptional regulator